MQEGFHLPQEVRFNTDTPLLFEVRFQVFFKMTPTVS